MTEVATYQSPESEKAVETVSVLIFDRGKFLTVRNGIDSRHIYGTYNLPGGRQEEGETPKQAAIRELEEETGLIAEERHLTEFPGNTLTSTVALRNEDAKMNWRVFICTEYSGMLRPEGRDGQKSLPEWLSEKDLSLVEVLPNVPEMIHKAQVFMRSEK